VKFSKKNTLTKTLRLSRSEHIVLAETKLFQNCFETVLFQSFRCAAWFSG